MAHERPRGAEGGTRLQAFRADPFGHWAWHGRRNVRLCYCTIVTRTFLRPASTRRNNSGANPKPHCAQNGYVPKNLGIPKLPILDLASRFGYTQIQNLVSEGPSMIKNLCIPILGKPNPQPPAPHFSSTITENPRDKQQQPPEGTQQPTTTRTPFNNVKNNSNNKKNHFFKRLE